MQDRQSPCPGKEEQWERIQQPAGQPSLSLISELSLQGPPHIRSLIMASLTPSSLSGPLLLSGLGPDSPGYAPRPLLPSAPHSGGRIIQIIEQAE